MTDALSGREDCHGQVRHRAPRLRDFFYVLERIVRVYGSLHLVRKTGRRPATVCRAASGSRRLAVKTCGQHLRAVGLVPKAMVVAEIQGMVRVKRGRVVSSTRNKAVTGLLAVPAATISGRSFVSIVFTSSVGLDAVINAARPGGKTITSALLR